MDDIEKKAYLKRIIELHDENLYLKNQVKELKQVISKFADVPLESVDQLVENERVSF